MPSPIAHIAAGVAIGLVAKRSVRASANTLHPQRLILGLAVVGSLLPDLDSIVGVIMGDFGKYHNNLSHSLLFGLIISLLVGVALKAFSELKLHHLFLPVFAGYAVHVLMDSATITRGVMLFWPLTDERYASPYTIFYGVRWSEDWLSPLHLITLVTELVFAAVVVFWAKWFSEQRNTKS